jgi:hypothetical protein
MPLSPVNRSVRRPLAPAVLVLLVAVAGCASGPQIASPSPSPSPSSLAASPEFVALPCAGRLNAQGVDVTTTAELERAARFRWEMGFPSDSAIVREMACRSDANLEDIPLAEEELRELERRTRVGHEINDIVQAYANRYPAEYGGIYIDQRRGGVVTILWTAHLAEHESAIRALLDPDPPIALLQVRWPKTELGRLQDKIAADREWFTSIHAALQTTGINVQENLLEIGISSTNPDAPGLIIAHFAAPAGVIRVVSDTWATVKGRVVRPDGSAPGENNFRIGEDTGGQLGGCWGGETVAPLGVQPSGQFEVRCPAGVRVLQVIDADAQPPEVLGEARVDVPVDGVVFVEVVIDR